MMLSGAMSLRLGSEENWPKKLLNIFLYKVFSKPVR